MNIVLTIQSQYSRLC